MPPPHPAINAAASLSVQIAGGSTLAASWPIAADAYEHVSGTVAAGDAHTYDVTNVPGSSILLMMIVASAYDPLLLCKTLFGATDVKLTGPIVLTNGQLTNVLNAAPTSVKIDNGTAKPVTIDLHILRLGT
jgi:hypothetical protein